MKIITLKEFTSQKERFTPGHRLCAGCAESIIVRQVLGACPHKIVAGIATSCLEVASTVYPSSAWEIPVIHNAFENIAATISGVEAAYRYRKESGEITEELRFVAFGGDGGTYDIGLQSLSGALERGTRFLYICLNNEGYMNTGIQRSSATPLYANTTTTPPGTASAGKIEWRKDLTAIVAAHHPPYLAQSTITTLKPHDLRTKATKGFEAAGPAFINALSPCSRGWGHEPSETVELADLAVTTCYWPLFEVIEGRWQLNYEPKQKKPIADWLSRQNRFRHIMKDEKLIGEIQLRIDEEWNALLERCNKK